MEKNKEKSKRLGIDDCWSVICDPSSRYFYFMDTNFTNWPRYAANILLSFKQNLILRILIGSRLLDYIQSIMSYFAPPVSAVYLMAVLFKRINEKVKKN